MQFATGHFLLQRRDILWRTVREEFVVGQHQSVRNRPHYAEYFARGFGDADIVAETLGHFALAVEAAEDRHRENGLPRQAVLALDLTMHQQIEFLLRGSQLNIGL